ncbi:hypothetical protein AX17_006913 [Amanita inopinata Kibby_2008]|nr:hypothetical protein AX17_006913 [Amanita inopinata Kibby_2008]
MASATLELGAPLHSTMGAMFVGVLVSAVLHGITLVQAFYYFTLYPKDAWFLKTLVTVLVVFDATHLSFITHTIYHYLVSNYYDHQALQRLIWSVLMEALFTGLNGAFVQCFYTLRVWRLSHKNYFLSGIILCLIVANAGCGTVWVILSMRMQTFTEVLQITPLTITINAVSTTIDVLIAVSLCILLHRSRTGFKKSDNMINRLMLFVVNTGVLTSICAISSLICLVVSPRTLIYASFYFCIGRLYTNSFLATLNARKSIAETVDDHGHMLVSLQPTVLSTSSASKSHQQNISIRIDTTQEAQCDESQKVRQPSSRDPAHMEGGVYGSDSTHLHQGASADGQEHVDKSDDDFPIPKSRVL